MEAKLVSVLKAHGPVMERGAMEDLCVADGMNRFSFHAFVSWSPVIAQYGHSVYGLLGTEVPGEQVEELLAERRAGRRNHRVLDQPRPDRRRQGVAPLPALEGRQHLCGDHRAGGPEEGGPRPLSIAGPPTAAPIGTLATKDGRAWGLGGFLRRHGARIGDYIVLTLDLENRTAALSWEEKGRVPFAGGLLADEGQPEGESDK